MGLQVNGVAIEDRLIREEMDRLREGYVEYVRENGGEASDAQLREWAEENLIEREVFRQEALATQPVPTDERAQQNISACPEYFASLPEGERLSRSKEALQIRALEKSIRKGVKRLTDEQLRQAYESSAELIATGETLRLSHICRLVGVGRTPRAEAFLELLRIRSDVAGFRLNWFDALQASDTFQQDYGTFMPVARGDLPRDLEEKLFALKPGEVSDVLGLGDDSLHLFRLLAVDPPSKVSFADAKEQLRLFLFERACQEALEAVYDALKAKAVIRR